MWTARGLQGRSVIAATVLAGAALLGAAAGSTPSASAAPASCSFADPGSGTYAQTLCWFDMSSYDAAQATSAAGQAMTIDLLSGYTLTFTLNVTGSAVKAVALPTYSAAFLGHLGYTGVSGKPALYQTASGTTTATESNITLKDPGGNTVTDYSLVGADAESTDTGETIGWTSAPGTLMSLEPLGNACSGGFTGVGTSTVGCAGSAAVGGAKTGAAILASTAPTTFTQTMHGTGLQAFGFGVLVAGVELTKTVVNGFSGDNFGVSITNSSNTVIGADNTSGATSASTGVVGIITNSSTENFTFAETATSGTLGNFDGSWSCTRNGAADASLPSGDAGASQTISVGAGDLVACTITNTAKPVSLTLNKTAGTPDDVNGDGLVDAGDTITYSFTVTNSGQITIDDVTITDPKVGTVTCPAGASALAPGDHVTCTATYTVTAADVTAGSVDNSATAGGIVEGTGSTTVSSPSSSTSTPTTAPDPELTLSKTVSPSSVTAAGQTVTYSFLITNTGNVTITDVTASEQAFTGTGTSPTVVCPPGAASLLPGASVQCTATYTVTQADVDAGSIDNTAVGSGTDPAGTQVDSPPSSASFTTTASPSLTIVKSASSSGGSGLHAGDVITYSYVVTNTGNVTLTNVDVDEGAFSGSGTLSSVTCPPGAASLAPAAQVTCTATYTVTQADVDAGDLSNSATATGTPPGGGAPGSVVSPPSSVTVPQHANPDLSLVKSASPATVSKAGTVVTYSFVVTNTGNVTINGIDVDETDFTGTGATPTITCPAGAASLLPGAEVTCTATYTVTQADIDSGSISNTATASGQDPADNPITSPPSTVQVVSTASSKLGLVKTAHPVDVNGDGVIDHGDRIDWTLVATNLGATTITHLAVSDPSGGTVTCAKTRLAPGESTHCAVASHTVTKADVTAGQVANTATATGTVMGTGTVQSAPAHAVVRVQPTPISTGHPKNPTSHPRNPSGPTLPFTGFPLSAALKIAASLIAAGVLLMFLTALRRRDLRT